MRRRARWASAVIGSLLLASGCGGGPERSEVALVGTSPAATDEALARSAEILAGRFETAGLAEPEVAVEDGRLVASFAEDPDPDLLATLLIPGRLSFRSVIETTPAPDPGPRPLVAPPSGWEDSAVLDTETARTELATRIPEAWSAAADLGEPLDPAAEQPAALAAFSQLSPEEIAVLPHEFTFRIPQITCAMLTAAPAPHDYPRTACDEQLKYRLAGSVIGSQHIASAAAEPDPATGAWHVEVGFTDEGQELWTTVTANAAEYADNPTWTNQLAVMLENVVIVAPTVLERIEGPAVISGDFTADEARLLAAQMGHGELPLRLATGS